MKTVEKLKSSLVHLPELLIVFFTPAYGQIAWVLLAILADTVTGIWAARRTKEQITSKKMSDLIPKSIVYIILLLLCHATDVVFGFNGKICALQLVSLALAGIELKSIDENFQKATGKGIFKPVINALKRSK